MVENSDGIAQFEPLCRGISYRHSSAREIVHHWRKTRRRGPVSADEHDEEPQPIARKQLSLPMAT